MSRSAAGERHTVIGLTQGKTHTVGKLIVITAGKQRIALADRGSQHLEPCTTTYKCVFFYVNENEN